MSADVQAQWHGLSPWLADAARIHEGEDREHRAAEGVVSGQCPICGHGIRIETAGETLDFREGLTCPRCRCNARQRASALVLLDALRGNDHARVYATEQATPFYVALKRRLPNTQGSEYVRNIGRRLRLSAWLWRQGVHEWLRYGDLTALPWADVSQDAIVSLDVLEHVPDHRAALRECARVLAPGAPLVLTVPFYDRLQRSETLARMRGDGTIEHVGEPEYHGDPVSGGVLCFHHFGWDLLDDLREAGFADAFARRVHDTTTAIPHGQWVVVARR